MIDKFNLFLVALTLPLAVVCGVALLIDVFRRLKKTKTK